MRNKTEIERPAILPRVPVVCLAFTPSSHIQYSRLLEGEWM